MKPNTVLGTEAQPDAVGDKVDGAAGGVLRPSRICYLTILSTTLWALVFYLQPSMQGGAGVFSLPLLSRTTTIAAARNPPPEQPVALPTAHDNRSTTAATPPQPPVELTAARDNRTAAPPSRGDDHCAGRYIYVHDLPPRFNDDLVRDCGNLRPWMSWMDMCLYVANGGMGPPLGDEGGVFSDRGWYATDQFVLDVIFNGRMKHYECLTADPSLAAAVFVPFYGSLDADRYIFDYNASMRDALPRDLVDWLVQLPEWRAMGGRDHFFVAGRTTWDFRRSSDLDEDWGNKLLNYPAVQNMTALILETSPWRRSNFAVPYPTYFHPATAGEVAAWQEKVRRAERRWLFAFAGAPRPGSNQTIRAEIIQQCGASSFCKLYHCGGGGGNCQSPGGVMAVFESADFCLQPRGDTMTRRSTFDTILAGCVPVFFHPGSAYNQYTLHFPSNHSSYSVLIMHSDVTGRNVSIEETLRKIPREAVRRMREEVIALIPRVVYADPRSRSIDFKDAFTVAVEAVIDRVARRRRGSADGGQD